MGSQMWKANLYARIMLGDCSQVKLKVATDEISVQTNQNREVEPGDWKKAIRQDRVIAGGPKDFMEVRHIVLRGTNEEIGRALANIAKERYGLKPEAGSDLLRTRAQRRYFEKNYPILHDRMRGVASAFGKRLNDDEWNFSSLAYLLGPPPGCSVVYYLPGLTADGNGVVSRNYDYGTGTVLDTLPKPGELPVAPKAHSNGQVEGQVNRLKMVKRQMFGRPTSIR
jgi:hypothetical protein